MPLPEGVTVEKPSPDTEPVAKRPPKASTCLSAAQCLEAGGDMAEGPKRQHQYDQAIAGYKQALEIDPTLSMATIHLARLHEKLGQMPLALGVYEAGLKNNPKDAGLWCELGMFHGRQKRFDKSIECLERAVELEPQNQVYSNNLGWSLARAGRFDQSFEHFAKTLGPARAHYNLALMARHLGDEALCRQHLAAALRLEPQLAEARKMLEEPMPARGDDPQVLQAGFDNEASVPTP
jgi:Tfp pilus assembly protein PilF